MMSWAAALLHDIGKFRERALGEKRDPQARYTHEAHSQEFTQSLRNFFSDESLMRELVGAVLRHHSPQYRDELIISAADVIAADERAESEGHSEETTKHSAPLQSILARLCDGSEQLYFSLKPLALDQEAIFAQPTHHVDQKAYERYWTSFHHEAQRLLPQDWQGLFYLLKKYCWCVVSSASRDEEHDISLFDHLRVTAAIAACLEAEGCSDDELKQIRSGASEAREKPYFLLLKGDISGIQDFIYTITSKGAAKGLRGRSVYLQLLTEVVALWILHKLELPFVNLLFQGGGHFMLLVPASKETKLRELQRSSIEKLFPAHGTDLYVALGWVPLSANDFNPENFSKKWEEAGQHANQAKRCRFSSLGSELHARIFEPQGGAQEGCDVCQADPGRWGLERDEDKEKCHLCASFEELGQKVARARYMMVSKLYEEQDGGRGWAGVLAQFGYRVDFLSELEQPPQGVNHVTLYRLNNTSFLDEEMLQWAQQARNRGISSSLGFRFLANVTPMEDEKILDFDALADLSQGMKRLGILRMDVDNLGKVFRTGIPHATISRIATVSSMLQIFFEGWVHKAADEFRNKVYAIYSGGDDIFFVGAWDAIVELAWKIRQDFADFTRNEQVTLSAGIAVEERKFPLYQAARNAKAALEGAKALPEKNAITFLGKCLGRANFRRAYDLQKKLVEMLEGKNGRAVPRSLLTKLSNVYALYARYPDRRKWAVRLIYDITQLCNAHKDFKDELQALQLLIGRDGIIGFLDVPVRWAEMLTMTREEGGRS